MKKILMPCFLALGLAMGHAQYYANIDFESGDFSATNNEGWTWFGAGSTTITTSCSAKTSWFNQFATSGSTYGGPAVDFSQYKGGQTNNGNKIDVTINWKKSQGSLGANAILSLAYFEYDEVEESWYIYRFGTPATLTTTEISNCQTLSGTISAGTLDPDKNYLIGAIITNASVSSTVNVYFDDIIIKQETTSTPDCTTFISPSVTEANTAGYQKVSWNHAPGATNYKLTIGNTPGSSNIFEGTTHNTFQYVTLAPNNTYYAKVVPLNDNGEATGCEEITFETNGTLEYCIGNSKNGTMEKISRVTYGGIDKSSTETAGYSDFTSLTANVERGTSSPMNITIASGFSTDKTKVWIDLNQDGAFDNQELLFEGSGKGPFSTNIEIPENAKLGKTRMRIRLYDNSTGPEASPCGTSAYGEVEDYSVMIHELGTLAVNDINKANTSVYPNPFKDMLKISDTKGIKSITINDMSGRQVKSLAPATELNLSSLKEGLYIVNINMEDGSVKTIKAIKK